ncbi:uncharacterized protein EI90DRAFT_3014291 [Cantharellus anzutake]|uniref:uncharacterized protein n=1 Tax=Cantharellus anzutake TaxID=1750568 RepID=UPI0019038CD0|nr:uncharacterized protein EI90DRAFT_3014291 [Cantharellus anzutake]KAF8336593.1 hypothetical protein EI90DRAFT_3014291 [Cantharellus anzutake]
MDRIDPQSPTQDLFTVKDLELTEGLFFPHFKLSPIPHEALPEHVHYACCHLVYHLTQVRKPLEAPNRSVNIFLNEQIMYWVEGCISISSFHEWAKLSVDWTAKDVIHMPVEVLSNVSGDLGFFSRLQEAYESADDSVSLCRHLTSEDPMSLYTPDLGRALRSLFVTLNNLRRHPGALAVIKEIVKLWRKLVAFYPISHPGFGSSTWESFCAT